MNATTKQINNGYEKPLNQQVLEYYHAVYHGDLETLKTMLDGGLPINSLIGYDAKQNVALYAMDDGANSDTLDAIEILLDRGIDINHIDDTGNSLLIYIIDVLVSWDFSEEIKEYQLKNKFEVDSVIRLRKTFDKLMNLKPSLAIGKLNMPDTENIFDFAMHGKFLHWFAEHTMNMNKEDRELFEGYRLASLFELEG